MSLKSIIDGVKKSFGDQGLSSSRVSLSLDYKEERVLIVYLFAGLGDAILLAPILQAIYRKCPSASIALLLRPLAAATLKRLDLPIKIHVVSEALLSYSNSKTSKLSRAVRVEERKLEAQIRKGAYTVTVDLTARQGVDVQRWVEYVQPQYRLGWRNPQSTDSHSIFGLSDARLMADRHWTKVNALPFSFFGTLDLEHEEMLACKSSPALERKAQGRWNTGKRILLIPGSRSEVKRWSLASFTEVARLLARKQDCSIMISGGPSERGLVTSLARALPKGTATYTGRDIGFLFALIRSADLVITNDTGPMHVAFLCCVPTLAFFTYMNPLVWGPLHTGERSCVFDQRSKNIDDTLNTEVVDASLRLLALSTA